MIYRLIENATCKLIEAISSNITDSEIGLAWHNFPFTMPIANNIEAWKYFPAEVKPINGGIWQNEIEMIIDRTEQEVKKRKDIFTYHSFDSDRGCYVFTNADNSNYIEIYGKATQFEAEQYIAGIQAIGKNEADAEKLANYKRYREQAYKAAGITAEVWSIARAQKDIDGDSTQYDALVARRDAIKLQYPKPTE